MVLMIKFFSRVKFVRPTLSELSITKTMSKAPQIFSQSDRRDSKINQLDSNAYAEAQKDQVLKYCHITLHTLISLTRKDLESLP